MKIMQPVLWGTPVRTPIARFGEVSAETPASQVSFLLPALPEDRENPLPVHYFDFGQKAWTGKDILQAVHRAAGFGILGLIPVFGPFKWLPSRRKVKLGYTALDGVKIPNSYEETGKQLKKDYPQLKGKSASGLGLEVHHLLGERIDTALEDLVRSSHLSETTYYNFPNGHFPAWRMTWRGRKAAWGS